MNYNNKSILVLGLSKSGIAAAKLANKLGAKVCLSEGKQPQNQDSIVELTDLGIKVEVGGHSDDFINCADLVIVSPGIPPHSEVIRKIKEKNIEIISELEFAYLNSNTPFIIITGTNGKTTTTSLINYILSNNYNVEACGNIGLPPCDLVNKNLDYYVCEASSFQLETSNTLTPLISIWTNFTPDHIDWHQGLENYFNAKAKIFLGNQTPKYSIINAKDANLLEFSKNINGELFYFGDDLGANCCYIENDAIIYKQNNVKEYIINLGDCSIFGEHNYQNIMCSIITAKLLNIDNFVIKKCLMDFKAPAHRMEKVRQYNNITFFNDSKATNPEASIVAINSFNNQNIVLIAGGRDKNTDLTEFCNSINKHITSVILIGEATERFKDNLLKFGFNNIYVENTLENAIDKSIELNPNVVLLSPACASFDMFSGYEQRGDVFREYVLSRV